MHRGTDLSIKSKRGEISDHLFVNNQIKHTTISFIWNTHPSRSSDMISLAELPCMTMCFSWMYPCYRSSEPGPGSFDNIQPLFRFLKNKKKYPGLPSWEISKQILGSVGYNDPGGAGRGTERTRRCWQLRRRRQKRWDKLLFPPLFSFSFCYGKDSALFGGSAQCVFSICFDL